ncbi:CinA family protein [Streptomyces sp. H27-H1]|uniref:CinA family protein n=1 Tax=Streptomyces sp. H27-H1 TaxID=2996461 RepID=UPI00227029B3|nr:CinA family protein [Streptomyces sp. H27-H1]MCY0930924.1 CinA family protein [Streptomyces sp. H27-H1]
MTGEAACKTNGAAGDSGAIAADVLRLLAESDATVAVAESLTGGMVAAELTAVPGASRSFRGSVTAYATELKHQVLGVDAGLLEAEGAVNPQVAEEMAAGVRRLLGASWGIATTGVAGPDPQDGQPVGTVFVAVAGPGSRKTAALRLKGSRAEIRRESARTVLELLASELRDNRRGQETEQDGGI